jgi:hypothetical protein
MSVLRRIRNRRAALLAVALLAVAAAAAGVFGASSSSDDRPPAEASESSNVEHVDFDQPFVKSKRLASVQRAQGEVVFRPVAPAAVGKPLSVFVNADEADPAQQTLALIYQHPKFGRFMLVELPNFGTSDDLAAIVANCTPDTPCESDWSLVQLNDGAQAALKVGSPSVPFETTGVIWMRGNVAFQLLGPVETFGREAALAIANVVEESP